MFYTDQDASKFIQKGENTKAANIAKIKFQQAIKKGVIPDDLPVIGNRSFHFTNGESINSMKLMFRS